MRRPIAVIRQDPLVTLGRFAPLLPDAVMYDPTTGQPTLPRSNDYAGLIILGGRMSVADTAEFPYLTAVNELMLTAIAADRPVLAICLGIQQLAQATGGQVEIGAAAGIERGVIEIELTAEAQSDPVLGVTYDRLGPRLFAPASHADAVRVPPLGAQLLASSALYPYHALRYGSALGVQFHPEADLGLMQTWARVHDDPDPDRFVAQYARHEAELAALAEAIATGFRNQIGPTFH